jgi:hypothetical protein
MIASHHAAIATFQLQHMADREQTQDLMRQWQSEILPSALRC